MEPFSFLSTMSGPDFLVVYAVWFVVLWVGSSVVQKRVGDDVWVTGAALLLFVGLGVVRVIVGSQHGMQRWRYLTLMMVVGCLALLIRVAAERDSWGSTSDSGCSTVMFGGGCGSSGGSSSAGSGGGAASCSGGSGCGGGGCGGCGGG